MYTLLSTNSFVHLTGGCKVLLVGPWKADGSSEYTCTFGEKSVKAELVQDGVLSCITPGIPLFSFSQLSINIWGSVQLCRCNTDRQIDVENPVCRAVENPVYRAAENPV